MAKVIIVYESKYGNTKLVAEIIVEGMNQVLGTEAILTELDDVDLSQIGEFDIRLGHKRKEVEHLKYQSVLNASSK